MTYERGGVTYEKLRDAVLALPVEERVKLAHALLNSFHQGAVADVDAAWMTELGRRADAVTDGTATPVPWGESKEHVKVHVSWLRFGTTGSGR